MERNGLKHSAEKGRLRTAPGLLLREHRGKSVYLTRSMPRRRMPPDQPDDGGRRESTCEKAIRNYP